MDLMLAFLAIIILLIVKSFKIVPQQQAWIVERFGKFHNVLEPGLNFLVPFIDVVAYKHSLKELPVDVKAQTAITQDNVTIILDGIVYIKVIDPKAASYGISDPIYGITQLAQTTMRSEIGKMTMDRTFEERNTLNTNIVQAINEAASTWGVQCMRYEIKDISPPKSVLEAMELQVAAERKKRADILDSEGKKQSQINKAEAEKQTVVLQSEGSNLEQINKARGEAEAIMLVAEATAKGIETLSLAIAKNGGEKAVAMKIAEKYIEAFANLAKESNTMIIPSSSSNISSVVAEAMGIYNKISTIKKD